MSRGNMGSLFRCFLAAQVVVFVLFGPHLAQTLTDRYRYYKLWDLCDGIHLLATLLLIALACVVVRELIRLLGRPFLLRFYDHLFVVALGAGVMANLWYYAFRPSGYHIGQFGIELQTMWLMLVGIVGYCLARPSSTLVLRCRQACQIVSPAMLIIGIQLISGPFYPAAMDSLEIAADRSSVSDASAPGNRQPCPVYIFVFDEWSYERSFEDGYVQPAYANTKALSDCSVLFHDAHSAGDETMVSLPSLLFQTSAPVVMKNGQVMFDRDGQLVPGQEWESIFSEYTKKGYRSCIVGATVPYTLWLGEQVDVCRTYSWFQKGETSLTKIGVHTMGAMRYWTDPWFGFLYKKLKTRVADDNILDIYRAIRQDTLYIINHYPASTIALFHNMVPHMPYIVDGEGDYLGPDDKGWDIDSVEGYKQNLTYMDKLLGEYVGAIKQRGMFDGALIVATSDHSWRVDPARKDGRIAFDKTHVPLMVKLPKQQQRLSITSRFEHRQLGALIDHALHTGADPYHLAHTLKLDIGEAQMEQLTVSQR